KQPSYRVVVADSRSPRDGRFIEVIGFHNPRTEPETVTIKEDRALHWLGVGAQPTRAVERLLKNQGTLARYERLKKGESLENLLAEAEKEAEARKQEAVKKPAPKKLSKKAKKKAEEPTPVAEEKPEQPAEEAPTPEAEAKADGGGEEGD
ncbi:MAG: 30S ribosomal protein S16, partial [Anaerolineales bacterium]